MKLKAVVGKTPCGGVVAHLIDEKGERLPGQRDVVLDFHLGQPHTITVTFLIGRNGVELVPSAVPPENSRQGGGGGPSSVR